MNTVIFTLLAVVAAACGVLLLGLNAGDPGVLGPLTLAAVVQSSYSERMPEATAGMFATMVDWDAITEVSADTDPIGFGLAIGRGTDDGTCLLGGALTTFLGVSIKDITLVGGATREDPDTYIEADNVGILRKGEIWVQVSGTPGPTDPVHYNATTGVFAASGGSGPVLGARWVKTSANGLGCLYLSGYGQATS